MVLASDRESKSTVFCWVSLPGHQIQRLNETQQILHFAPLRMLSCSLSGMGAQIWFNCWGFHDFSPVLSAHPRSSSHTFISQDDYFFFAKRETLLISMQRSESINDTLLNKIFMTMELSLSERLRDEDRQRLSFWHEPPFKFPWCLYHLSWTAAFFLHLLTLSLTESEQTVKSSYPSPF